VLDTRATNDKDEDAEVDSSCQWLPFEFKYKPGNVARAPAWVSPHQPRLDWQMWFGALAYDWQALKSPHIVGLFCPYSGSLLTLVWSAQASDTMVPGFPAETSAAIRDSDYARGGVRCPV
jgi:hypothetical protein